jgi:hypothetical protein
MGDATRASRVPAVGAIAGVVLLASSVVAAAAEPLRNWFDDPYFQVRDGVGRCPVPRGPYTTEAEMRRESHSRAERGTSCWLAKQCTKQNSYLYDPGIAAAVRGRFAATAGLRDSSLWVTVQRRIVWIEGCVPSTYRDGTLESLLRDTEDVERIIVNVTSSPRGKPPYRTLSR